MATATINLLSVAGNPTGAVTADLEYNDATLKCTAVVYTNTSQQPYSVEVIRTTDGVSLGVFTIPANTPTVRRNIPNNFMSVTVTNDDVIAPVEVEGRG